MRTPRQLVEEIIRLNSMGQKEEAEKLAKAWLTRATLVEPGFPGLLGWPAGQQHCDWCGCLKCDTTVLEFVGPKKNFLACTRCIRELLMPMEEPK